MTRLGTRMAAGALVGFGAAYMILSLATGRSARAEVPPELAAAATDLGLDVWKSAALLVREERAVVVDVRPAEAYARYHLPGATSLPEASAADVKRVLADHSAVLVYAGKDEVAEKLVRAARVAAPGARVHYLVDGARAWYLALTLPVPLFAESSPPDGYAEALAAATGFFASPAPALRPRALEAVQTLARIGYQPTLLTSGRKAAAAGPKKKIGGGCG